MITKQQALEFIYELSKLHVIHLDIPCGYAYIDKEEDWLSEILELARLPNGRELIEIYCLNYEVDIRDNIIPKVDFVEKTINDMYRRVS